MNKLSINKIIKATALLGVVLVCQSVFADTQTPISRVIINIVNNTQDTIISKTCVNTEDMGCVNNRENHLSPGEATTITTNPRTKNDYDGTKYYSSVDIGIHESMESNLPISRTTCNIVFEGKTYYTPDGVPAKPHDENIDLKSFNLDSLSGNEYECKATLSSKVEPSSNTGNEYPDGDYIHEYILISVQPKSK